MRTILLTTLLMSLGMSEAMAAAWEAKTGRQPLSVREVERSLIMEKGWLEFGLGVDWKIATGYWDADGVAQDFEDANWTYSTERLDIRYGISRRSELYWQLPFHYMHLTNEKLGTDTSTFGLGDPTMGYKFEVFRSRAPTTSIILYGQVKVPAGNESPGQYIGGPYAVGQFVISTDTPDYTLGVRAKQQAGPLGLIAGAGYTYRQSATVQYIIEVTEYQFGGRMKPGSYFFGELGLQLGLGPVVLQGDLLYKNRDATYIGTTGEEFLGNNNLLAVADSDGWSLDTVAGLLFNITRGLDIAGSVGIPLRGEDLQFFPLESIHPTRGYTYSGTLKLRY